MNPKSLFLLDVEAPLRYSAKNPRYLLLLLRVALICLRGRSDPRAGAAAEVGSGVVRSSFLCPCCVGVAIGFTKSSRTFSSGLKYNFACYADPGVNHLQMLRRRTQQGSRKTKAYSRRRPSFARWVKCDLGEYFEYCFEYYNISGRNRERRRCRH